MKHAFRYLSFLFLITVYPHLFAQHSQRDRLILRLTEQAQRGYMVGHQDDLVYGHSWNGDKGKSDVRMVCGDYPAVVGFDLSRLELGHKQNIDGVNFRKMHDEAIRHYKRGGLLVFTWHVNNPATGEDAWHTGDGQAVRSILPGGANHEKMIQWIDSLARFFCSLRVDGKQIPVLFRPWHEHTGSWFWWGQDLCTATEFKALWRMTAERLRYDGANQLIYVYSSGTEPGRDSVRFLERYPGDDVVDVMAADSYLFNGRKGIEEYVSSTGQVLRMLTEVGQSHHKLIALAETGSETIPIDNWWTTILQPLIDPYPISYVLLWRNSDQNHKHYYAPFPGEPSAPDFIKFYKASHSLFLRDVRLYH